MAVKVFSLREVCRLRKFENKLPRQTFGLEIMRMGSGENFTAWNFIVFCRSSNIVRVIKSVRLRWTGQVARTEELAFCN